MRPNEESIEQELYECFDCGARVRAPDTRSCERCGGELEKLSRSRDL